MSRRLGILLLVAASACGIFEPHEDEIVGVVALDEPNLVPLSAPDTVTAGVDFSVVVTTVGNGSCTRAGDVRVVVVENAATLTPFDIRRGGDCTSSLSYIEHMATVRFEQSGPALLTLTAVDFDGDAVELEYPLVVR